MRNMDTITCAITPAAGCTAQSASVFRAVSNQTSCCGNGAARNNNAAPCHNEAANSCGCNAAPVAPASCCGNGNCWNNNAAPCHNEAANTCGCNAAPVAPASCCGKGNGCTAAVQNSGGQSCHQPHQPCSTPGMVYETQQHLHDLHGIEEAIRKGTLFPQLYMPMRGECADACGANLCEGQAEAFAAWELRLYLNTHPCDQQALQLFRKYARKADQPNYAGAFADDCGDRWNWTEAPWPWEFNAACECGCNCE